MTNHSTNIEAHRGAFHLGHTSQDVASVLADVSAKLGQEICVVWDFADAWGCGGNSELMLIDRKGRFCEAPDALVEFLYQPGNEIDGAAVMVCQPGRVRYRRTLERGEHLVHNYVLRTYEGEAPRV